MKGYFGIGTEGGNKAHNLGNIYRTANAMGAHFAFTLDGQYRRKDGNQTDTSKTAVNLPFYEFDGINDFAMPKECKLVGVELTDESINLPEFKHPRCAAYVLGPERGNLSDETLAKCDYVIKIPMKFCVNVGVAAAMVMYDRLISESNFPPRPQTEIGNKFLLPEANRKEVHPDEAR